MYCYSKVAVLFLIEFGTMLEAIENTQLIEHCICLMNVEYIPGTAALNSVRILSVGAEPQSYVCEYQVFQGLPFYCCYLVSHFDK